MFQKSAFVGSCRLKNGIQWLTALLSCAFRGHMFMLLASSHRAHSGGLLTQEVCFSRVSPAFASHLQALRGFFPPPNQSVFAQAAKTTPAADIYSSLRDHVTKKVPVSSETLLHSGNLQIFSQPQRVTLMATQLFKRKKI